MKQKRGLQLILILILIITLAGMVNAGPIDDCNLNGGIWCGAEIGGSCKGADTINALNLGNCNVKISQNVTLDKEWTLGIGLENPKTFEFDALTVDATDVNSNPIVLQFFNTVYGKGLMAANASCAQNINCGETNDEAYCYGGLPGTNDYSVSLGGSGGNGSKQDRSANDIFGGGGGAGASGGKIGISGGDGKADLPFNDYHYFSGGAGSEGPHGTDDPKRCGGYQGSGWGGDLAYGAGGENGGRAGGFVVIKAKTLVIEGNVSVSGENGANGMPGWGLGDGSGAGVGADGGGPGAGGGGAGSITLVYNHISGGGKITADGGDGGAGGNGADGRKDADSGPGGGAGGGAGGIITLSGNLENSEDFSNVYCEGGTGGEPGNLPPHPNTEAQKGQNGPSGSCGDTSELDPTGAGEINLANCNDGQDNDGDTKFDMDDIDCRRDIYEGIYYWDSSIWDQYYSVQGSEYDKSAKNYKDYVCGDDNIIYCAQKNSPNGQGACNLIPIKEWCLVNDDCEWIYLQNYNDIGGLSPDNEYLCLDSIYISSQSGATPMIQNPGNNYAWFGVDGSLPADVSNPIFSGLEFSQYQIFQANQNHFISNGDEWYWCGATETESYGSNEISEFGTFEVSPIFALNYCTGALQRIFDKESEEDKKVIECSDTITNCFNRILAEDAFAWCSGISFRPGHFMDDCGTACYYKTENAPYRSFISNYPFGGVLCEVFPYEDGCLIQQGYSGGDEGYADQDFCANFEDLCLDGVYNPTLSCEVIYDNFNYPYNGGEGKICGLTEKCMGGDLIPSSDGRCCVGSNAYCEEYEQGDCIAMGGLLQPNNNDALYCTGVVVSDCCLYGSWIDASQAQFKVNESFTCYAQEGNSYLQECCGGFDCYNTVNPLGGWTLPVKDLFSTNGVPLHSIANFDNYNPEEEKINRRVRTFRNSDFGDELKLSNELQYSFSLNWKNFESLDFDIMYNVYTDYNLHIVDKEEGKCSILINNYIVVKKGPSKWQHVSIPISDINGCTLSSIKELYIVAEGVGSDNKVSVALDNFFLKTPRYPQTGDLVHSENRFCSGNWGDWVENLDGLDADDDKGFVGQSSPELAVYGPYMDACNGVISFGWTGSVCCGDDTRIGENGEFWSDIQAACWNGTAVYHNEAVYGALGLSPLSNDWSSNSSLHVKSLLFYNSGLWSCNISETEFTERVSYDGITQDNQDTIGDVISGVKDPYSIMGDWICIQNEGWTKLDEFNRVRPLVAALSAVGEASSGNYTLMCGDYKEMSNQLGVLDEEALNLTNYACVLKAGKNDLASLSQDGDSVMKFSRLSSRDGFVVVGLEIKDRELSFEEYREKVLAKYPIMNIQDYDCNSLTSDINSTNFFTLCGTDSVNDLRIYYNQPLNLIILSGYTDDLSTLNIEGFSTGHVPFLQRMWTAFKNFFKNLFKEQREILMLNDFDKSENTKDFYLSKQGSRKISGALQESGIGGGMMLRVEYVNFTSSVKILKDAIVVNYPGIQAYYESQGTNQSISVLLEKDQNADWKQLTSILRVELINKDPKDFGDMYIEPKIICEDTDSGDNPLNKGTASNGFISKTDSCEDESTVLEAYCVENGDFGEVSVKNISCPATSFICKEGACVLR
ncbi:MAG: hypothetical protein ACP5N2_06850 [Candidatus Nanoarchaeia archaeon]